MLKIDLGCGTNKRPGFLGIDRRKFDGVDGVTDLTQRSWSFKQSSLGSVQLLQSSDGEFILPDNSVTEATCSHFLEHLEHNQRHPERVRFMNELWRVLVPGGKATIITPHWASNRAYGDFTHADKPVSEMFYAYLDRSWREENAPDTDAKYNPDGYTCDFHSQIGYTPHPELHTLQPEHREIALNWYKEAVLDLHVLLTSQK
jgi:SAM-dependent methyltransferase